MFLRKHIGGPLFDIEAIWEAHTRFEFEGRDVEGTMGTMVVGRNFPSIIKQAIPNLDCLLARRSPT
jgi:hypothetical protein